MSIIDYVKRNKEGAIVGGIIGLGITFLPLLGCGVGGECHSNSLFNIILQLNSLWRGFSFIGNTIVGALLGAYIDSKYKPFR